MFDHELSYLAEIIQPLQRLQSFLQKVQTTHCDKPLTAARYMGTRMSVIGLRRHSRDIERKLRCDVPGHMLLSWEDWTLDLHAALGKCSSDPTEDL